MLQNIVLSRRVLLEEKLSFKKDEILAEYASRAGRETTGAGAYILGSIGARVTVEHSHVVVVLAT